jgi:hypothetical protein
MFQTFPPPPAEHGHPMATRRPPDGHPTATRRPLPTIARALCSVNPAPSPIPRLNSNAETVNGLIELHRRIVRGSRTRDNLSPLRHPEPRLRTRDR